MTKLLSSFHESSLRTVARRIKGSSFLLPLALAASCYPYDLDFGNLGGGGGDRGDYPSGQCRTDNDCPQQPCACLDPTGEGACQNQCPIMGCVDNQCVDVSEPSFDFCGGLVGAGCAEGEYCHFEQDAQCGAADQTGQCEPMPEACILIFDPVCGCDGQTYGNSCTAAAAGVSVSSSGECNSGLPSNGHTELFPLTANECEDLGGTIVGDIGDGAIHRPDYLCENGEPPLGRYVPEEGAPIPVEGAVCCPL